MAKNKANTERDLAAEFNEEDPSPTAQFADDQQEVAQAASDAHQADADDKTSDAVKEAQQTEQELVASLTAETDQDGADAVRQLVYDTANKSSGGGVSAMSNEGAPLTAYEVEANHFFKEQNEIEKQIDQVEVTRENAALFAGTVPNALQSGELGPVGSATVTNYVGETIHPYPPTDFNAAAIVAGDLTTDPILATLGLVATNPMPPENNVHDIRETDGRIDTKDYSRRLRVPNDLIVEARRAKYPAGIEAPV